MDKIKVWVEPGCQMVEVEEKSTISDALEKIGRQVDQPCGGRGTCGKCRVRTAGGDEPTEAERDIFSPEELALGWRLSCVSLAKDQMTVILPESGEEALQILEAGAGDISGELAPENQLQGYRLACDVGTTTVVVYLLHPEENKILHTASALNRQISFGGDVISRIFAVCEDMAQLSRLQEQIVTTINDLIGKIMDEYGIARRQIGELRIAGNTTMEHLLLGRDPRGLGKSPFTPDFLEAEPVKASALALNLEPDTPVALLPNLSSFVGADLTAGIYYTGMAEKEELSLLLDIGTNNEMVIGQKGILYGCSAAAGPALEGAQISTGMRAAPGAVEKAWREGETLCLKTIGGEAPVGLCGSGLIDLLALLVREKVILPDGRFAPEKNQPDNDFGRRIRKAGKRHLEFVYCFAKESGTGRDLTLTQKDVREVQLAKSAISVGVDKLLERMHASVSDLKKVYLAGAFGNYIDQGNARELGILPEVDAPVVRAVSNSAGLGVCQSFYDPEYEAKQRHIIDIFHSMNLASEDDFQKRFLERLAFSGGQTGRETHEDM